MINNFYDTLKTDFNNLVFFAREKFSSDEKVELKNIAMRAFGVLGML